MNDRTKVTITSADAKALLAKMSSEDEARAPDFALEPSDGNIPPRVIDALCAARTTAKDYAEAYSGAVTAQAEKYKLRPAALKRFINAREADKMDDLDAELNDLEKLIG